MCRELAMTPVWAVQVISESDADWSEETAAQQKQLMASWGTVAECKAQFEKNFPAWDSIVRNMSKEKFSETKWLPYNGGRDHTYLEMLDYVRWNCSYHLGQIAYIQTLYGDRNMY
jgi:hypothetical protein